MARAQNNRCNNFRCRYCSQSANAISLQLQFQLFSLSVCGCVTHTWMTDYMYVCLHIYVCELLRSRSEASKKKKRKKEKRNQNNLSTTSYSDEVLKVPIPNCCYLPFAIWMGKKHNDKKQLEGLFFASRLQKNSLKCVFVFICVL